VIRPLQVWDTAAYSESTIDPGVLIASCRIRHSGGAYTMEFDSAGRLYTCALYLFQARTKLVDFLPVPESAAPGISCRQ
jgi:hypothetical protein